MTYEEAVRMYTINAAYAVFRDHQLGQIKEGFLADFVVLDRPASSDPHLLLHTQPHQVWVDGVCRHSLS